MAVEAPGGALTESFVGGSLTSRRPVFSQNGKYVGFDYFFPHPNRKERWSIACNSWLLGCGVMWISTWAFG
jgi:hypothetical protein